MLYILIKPLINIFYRLYYRIHYIGLDTLPANKALILAPNHVNGFVDPILLGMKIPQRVRFFARGDVFKNPIAKYFLNQLSISPVFRIQEGYSEVKKNDATFLEIKSLLSNNKTILIFPEAVCVQEKRLRPLKKGLARIAFQTEESFDFKKEVLIFPIGINYESPKRFRSKVYIDVGKLVSLTDYEQQYSDDKVKAINTFTKDFEEQLARHLIIIRNKKYDALFDFIIEIYLNEWMVFKNYDIKNKTFEYTATKEIANIINEVDKSNEYILDSLDEKAKNYFKLLKENNLRDHLLNPDSVNKMNLRLFIFDYLKIYLGAPIYFIGSIFNLVPFYVSKKYSDKKIRHNEFYASVRLNMFMLLYVIYYFLQLFIIALVFRNWWVLAGCALFIPLLGYYNVYYYTQMKKILGRWRLLRLVRKDKQEVEELVKQRTEFLNELRAVIKPN